MDNHTGVVVDHSYRKSFKLPEQTFETGVLRRVVEISEKVKTAFNESDIERTIKSLQTLIDSPHVDHNVKQRITEELDRYKLIQRIYNGVI